MSDAISIIDFIYLFNLYDRPCCLSTASQLTYKSTVQIHIKRTPAQNYEGSWGRPPQSRAFQLSDKLSWDTSVLVLKCIFDLQNSLVFPPQIPGFWCYDGKEVRKGGRHWRLKVITTNPTFTSMIENVVIPSPLLKWSIQKHSGWKEKERISTQTTMGKNSRWATSSKEDCPEIHCAVKTWLENAAHTKNLLTAGCRLRWYFPSTMCSPVIYL